MRDKCGTGRSSFCMTSMYKSGMDREGFFSRGAAGRGEAKNLLGGAGWDGEEV